MSDKYIYNFDTDVMHPFMLRSFKPFFVNGNVLELGSFRGDFTKRLASSFEYIVCVDASGDDIELAKWNILTSSSGNLASRIRFIQGRFEEVILPTRYDNIIMIHTLEHLDDPVLTLQRINDEWLSERGRLFLVCPNALAPSRQIAVKMGLISHNTAVTTAEAKHGHRRTYTSDVLEWDVRAAGLNIIHSSGIFFKALANFQWDRLLEEDIISREYLEGCYQLGQKYPDLCASIFLVCKRGSL